MFFLYLPMAILNVKGNDITRKSSISLTSKSTLSECIRWVMPTTIGDAINCGREIKSANPDMSLCKGECAEDVITIVWKEKDKLKIYFCQA